MTGLNRKRTNQELAQWRCDFRQFIILGAERANVSFRTKALVAFGAAEGG
jgi:hypothetical protein